MAIISALYEVSWGGGGEGEMFGHHWCLISYIYTSSILFTPTPYYYIGAICCKIRKGSGGLGSDMHAGEGEGTCQ